MKEAEKDLDIAKENILDRGKTGYLKLVAKVTTTLGCWYHFQAAAKAVTFCFCSAIKLVQYDATLQVDNYRKEKEEDRQRQHRDATAGILHSLLPVLDVILKTG